jgi:fatty-acid peroxygenase
VSLAAHRDEGGTFLPTGIAVIELINILRPIVAMARYIVFAAIELHRNEN